MTGFDDLLEANKQFADTFDLQGFDGIARAGVAMVTCMDSRIDPLAMIGLRPGDAKILRNPGGRLSPSILVSLVLGTNLLNVERILIVQHTRCAVASASEQELKDRISERTGLDAAWLDVHAVNDQLATLTEDVHMVRSHPLIPDTTEVAGFIYDVDTGLLDQVVG